MNQSESPSPSTDTSSSTGRAQPDSGEGNQVPAESIVAQEIDPPASFFAGKLTIRQLLTTRFRGVVIAVAVIGVVGVALAFFAAAKLGEDDDSQQIVILPVKTKPAEAVNRYMESRRYTGVIKSKRASELSFEINGQVIELLADEGTRVKQGAVLAKLDTRQLNAKKDELIARRNQAQAVLDELVAGPRVETIEAVQAEVKSLEAQLKLAKLNLNRRKDLVDSRSIAKEEYERAFYSQQATAENLNAAKKRLTGVGEWHAQGKEGSPGSGCQTAEGKHSRG